MIQSRMFRRHFSITAAIVLGFILLGFFAFSISMKLSAPLEKLHPSVFFARVIDEINFKDRVSAMKTIEAWDEKDTPPMRMLLINDRGQVIYPKGESISFDWNQTEKPGKPYESLDVKGLESEPFFAPPGPGGPGGPGPRHELIRLKGEPAQYLFSEFDPKRRPPPPGGFIFAFSSLVISVLLGIGFGLMLIFRSLRESAELADSVIADLQNGNLKARFPIRKMDEIGKAMSRFNRMADEIERLVEHLRSVEVSRIRLLQELTHDLRTPVASLKNLLETLDSLNQKKLLHTENVATEFLALSLKEVDYFERLVEDLLLLAQVSEPRYQAEKAKVSLRDIFDDEAEGVATRFSSESSKISLVKELPEDPVWINGDAHLIRRLFRNGIENAFSFAKKSVRIQMKIISLGKIEILIQDDGPGFSPGTLASFGVRKASRVLTHDRKSRLSVGLGSVIMKAVTEIHRGTLQAENRTAPDSSSGAVIRIVLPTS